MAAWMLFAIACAVASDGESAIDSYQARIEAIDIGKDSAAAQGLIAELEAGKEAGNDPDYYAKLVRLCTAVLSVGEDNSELCKTVRRLAAEALASTTVKPVAIEAELLWLVQADFDYGNGIDGGDLWRKERLRRLELWLNGWNRVNAALDGLGPVEVAFLNNVGGQPRDPELREKWEERTARNLAAGKRNEQRSLLEYFKRKLRLAANCYVVDAYGVPPFDTPELNRALSASGMEKQLEADLLDKVNKRVTTHTAAEKTMHENPPTMRFIEIPPPGTAVYHSDARLRKKVAFKPAAPKIEEILDQLRDQTGVTLTRADDIQNDYPARGGIIFSGTPVWKVMDKVAAYERVEGRWEKDGDGYRLVRNGNPVAPPEINEFAEVQPSPGWQRGVRLFGIALTTATIGVLLYLLIRRKRLATS